MRGLGAAPPRDRFGLGWRPELAAGLLANAGGLDLVEVLADDWTGAPRERLRALRTLAERVPVVVHGVSLGLASRDPVDERRLAALARVVEAARPLAWSEHLAFVRGAGRELGHLAAPPRCQATLDGLAHNVERARLLVGERPQLENVASLYEPPGSDRDEASFVCGALAASGAELLLDLHNLHANATNFGFDPVAYLRSLPAQRIAAVHLAGGRWVQDGGGGRRLLDDHQHEVPDPVFALLEETGRRAPGPLTVILERDGRYPPFAALLAELERARAALARGRAARLSEAALDAPPSAAVARAPAAAAPPVSAPGARPSGGPGDEAEAESWLAEVLAGARDAGSAGHGDALGLALAADSFARKRAGRRLPARPAAGFSGRLRRLAGL